MAESKKMFSRLDELFAKIRRQDSVMDLHEVEALIENQLPVVGKKAVGAGWILGVVSLIVLANLGIIWLWNAESDAKKMPDKSILTANTFIANSKVSEKKNNSESVFDNPAKNNPENIAVVKTKPVNAPPIRVTVKSANINFSYQNKKIRMIVAPDNEVEELMINNETISSENFSKHEDVIAEGLKIKKQNQKENSPAASLSEKEKTNSKANRALMNEMVKQLSADGLIHDHESFDFRLTGTELFLNGQKQDAGIFDQYKNHFLKITGEPLPENYNLHIKR